MCGRVLRPINGDGDAVKDFRDQPVQDALEKAVGPYRPEKTLRLRLARVAAIAALALAAFAGFWALFNFATSENDKQRRAQKPIPVNLLPPPAGK